MMTKVRRLGKFSTVDDYHVRRPRAGQGGKTRKDPLGKATVLYCTVCSLARSWKLEGCEGQNKKARTN